MRNGILLLFLALLLIEACSQSYIVNMNAATQNPEGRNLFVSKCNACHRLYSPDSFTAAAWDSILVPMQSKAKLDYDQRIAIYNWILEIKNNSFNSVRIN